MKLYEVPRNTKVKMVESPNLVVDFEHIDGMYSFCTIPETKEIVHLAAWTEVEIINE